MPRISWRLALLAAAASLLSACSLAGDVTPPPGRGGPATALPAGATLAPQPQTTPTATVADIGYPAVAPSAAEGGLLFAEHCTRCHGTTGRGDGEMVTQLPAPPPDMTDPGFARARSPLALFTAITTGNLAALMPPFGKSLSEAERWSLVAYVTTLSTPPDQMERGRVVYNAHCAQCHGAGGQGDGAVAAGLDTPAPDFTDLPVMVARSQTDLKAVVAGGDALHPFAETLSEAEQWAVVDVVRAFAYVYAAPGEVLAERAGALTGQVVNGTAGGMVPAGLEITLHSFDTNSLVDTLTTTVGTDGRFDFGAVAYVPGRQFLVSTVYSDVTYGSEVASFDAQGAPLALALPIYETTSDPAALSVAQMHMFVEFLSPTEVSVSQVYILSNAGDRTLAATGASLLQFNLPAEATGLAVQNAVLDQDYFRNADGFGALWQVAPGESAGQLLISFRLPYDGELSFSQVMHYPVAGVNVLMTDLGVKLEGPNLLYLGPQSFQDQTFRNFSRTGLAAGETLSFDLTGTAGSGATAPISDNSSGWLRSTSATGLAVGLGALAAALSVIGLWLYRRPGAADPATRREELLEALAALDTAYAAGEVAQADYVAERADLKAELRAIWNLPA